MHSLAVYTQSSLLHMALTATQSLAAIHAVMVPGCMTSCLGQSASFSKVQPGLQNPSKLLHSVGICSVFFRENAANADNTTTIIIRNMIACATFALILTAFPSNSWR